MCKIIFHCLYLQSVLFLLLFCSKESKNVKPIFKHRTPPRPTSPHLTPPHPTPPHRTAPYPTLPHPTRPQPSPIPAQPGTQHPVPGAQPQNGGALRSAPRIMERSETPPGSLCGNLPNLRPRASQKSPPAPPQRPLPGPSQSQPSTNSLKVTPRSSREAYLTWLPVASGRRKLQVSPPSPEPGRAPERAPLPGSQDGPKTAPRRPKMIPSYPKTAQDGRNMPQDGPHDRAFSKAQEFSDPARNANLKVNKYLSKLSARKS